MKTTIINIKTEPQIKANAQMIANDLGISLSAIINAYLNQLVKTKEVYFSLAPRMSSKLENLLDKVESDIRENKNLSKTFSTKKEVEDYLLSL